jgi:hypothetical protein
MCVDCECGSIIGGFEHCRKTDKYPHTRCKHYKPDPLYSDYYHMDMEAWEQYPVWNKTLQQIKP